MEIILFIIGLSIITVHADTPGSYIDVGMSVHSTIDSPEYVAPNPIGNIEIGIQRDKWTAYYRHDSSIPYWEHGYGFNQVGVKYRVWSNGF